MRRYLYALSIAIGLTLFLWQVISPAFSNHGHIALINIDGNINPTNSRYLSRSIKKATEENAVLMVVKLNTPGGMLSSTRDMVESLLSADVPVAVYVSPPGARAASAGTFITAAANFAVMAPGTNIGAASPVTGTGGDLPSTLEKKINEDTKALIRSIADARGRNSEALEATVTEARSYSASEAVELNVVNFIAPNMDELFLMLEGMEVDTAGGPKTLHLEGAETREIKRTLLEHFLGFVGNPNVALIFIAIGFGGLLLEMFTPGTLGPGIVGALFSGMAIAGMGQLPVSWVGVGFILMGALMVIVEFQIQETDYSILGFTGVVAFIIGLFLIFGGFFSTPDMPEPGSNARLWILCTVSGVILVVTFLFFQLLRPTQSVTGYVSDTGGEYSGQTGVATSDLAPSGTVMLDGVEWHATTDLSHTIRKGEEVQVVGVYGNTLKVSNTVVGVQASDGRKNVIGNLLKRVKN